jgi:hypothetical protein
MSCDPTTNGFQFTENYVLGPSDEELTMLDGSNNWKRTNVSKAISSMRVSEHILI